METFFAFLAKYQTGIIMLLVILAFVVFVVQWLAWIFNWGRFAPPKEEQIAGRGARARYLSQQVLLSEFIFRVIRDFRNFLALVLVIIFAVILVYAVFKAQTQDEMTKNLQSVMATLGGLIGSIIGYYFGESAVRSFASENGGPAPAVQTPTSTEPGGAPPVEPIVPVETPASLQLEETSESEPSS